MSHVVVIDSTARRAQVKVSPGSYLSDVLSEACKKFGHDPSQFGLKHNKKKLDLSLTFRLSGLSSGAKLELIQVSQSASAISVAVQLPEAPGSPSQRLSEKFASTETLWLILRHFESSKDQSLNLTARSHADGSYEQPVLQILGRELATLTDLQKSLSQLGLSTGSVLMKLSFRKTDEPFHAARASIDAYFRSTGREQPVPTPSQVASTDTGVVEKGAISDMSDRMDVDTSSKPDIVQHGDQKDKRNSTNPDVGSDIEPERQVEVYAPPSSSTPQAARVQVHDEDLIPSVAQAKQHQSMLTSKIINKRLPSELEIAKAEQEEKEKVAAIKSIKVKIRYPDQSSIVRSVLAEDTPARLYDFVRSTIVVQDEAFHLVFTGEKGRQVTLPVDEGTRKLIKDYGLRTNTLLTFVWDDASSGQASQRQSILIPELAKQAQQIVVPDLPTESEQRRRPPQQSNLREEDEGEDKSKRKGIPKWLKLGKK